MASLFLGLAASCGSKKTVASVETPKPAPSKLNCSTSNSYSNNIKGLIDMHCAKSCHSASKHADGIDLSTYAAAKVYAANGRLMGSITHAIGYKPMPSSTSKLGACEINQIKAARCNDLRCVGCACIQHSICATVNHGPRQ